jgi:hypothetical protein
LAVPIEFDETLLDPNLFESPEGGGGGLQGWPVFANTVIRNEKTGVYKVNVNRFDPTEILTLDCRLLTPADRAYLLKMWRGGYGSGVGCRLRVPYDFTATGEVQGTINAGQTKSFQLVKTYTRTGVTARQDVRPIVKPVVNTNLATLGAATAPVTLYEADGVTPRIIAVPFAVRVNGLTSGFTYTINNTTGTFQIISTVTSGTVAADFTFDIPAAFMGNSLQFSHDVSSSTSNVQFREILPVELGIVIT